MEFGCAECNAKYRLPDEKVAGRTLRMSCRKCEAEIIIRGSASDPTALSEPAERMTDSTLYNLTLAPDLPPPSEGPPGNKDAIWHVSINDTSVGPISEEDLGRKIDAGAVSEYSLVWKEGFDEWLPLATIPELMALLQYRRQVCSIPPSILPPGFD